MARASEREQHVALTVVGTEGAPPVRQVLREPDLHDRMVSARLADQVDPSRNPIWPHVLVAPCSEDLAVLRGELSRHGWVAHSGGSPIAARRSPMHHRFSGWSHTSQSMRMWPVTFPSIAICFASTSTTSLPRYDRFSNLALTQTHSGHAPM